MLKSIHGCGAYSILSMLLELVERERNRKKKISKKYEKAKAKAKRTPRILCVCEERGGKGTSQKNNAPSN